MYEASELHRELTAAGIPVDGVSVTDPVNHIATINYSASATPAQQTQGASILAGFDWVNADLNWLRAQAAVLDSDPGAQFKLIRAVVLLTVAQLNILREWLTAPTNSLKAAAAGATSLATFQSAVAALPTLADLTGAQAKTAILNQISSGAAD